MNALMIQRLLAPLKTALRGMLSLGVLQATDDSKNIQQVQVSGLAGQVRSKVNRYQNFGHTSHAPKGAEPIMAYLGGDPSRPVILVMDDGRYRLKELAEGESAIYNSNGDYAWLKADGTFEVVASAAVNVTAPNVKVTASTKITFDSPLVECTDKLHAAGEITSDADVKAGSISLKDHKHSGVTTGGGQTGKPV